VTRALKSHWNRLLLITVLRRGSAESNHEVRSVINDTKQHVVTVLPTDRWEFQGIDAKPGKIEIGQ
jgi:hypothetical protein